MPAPNTSKIGSNQRLNDLGKQGPLLLSQRRRWTAEPDVFAQRVRKWEDHLSFAPVSFVSPPVAPCPSDKNSILDLGCVWSSLSPPKDRPTS